MSSVIIQHSSFVTGDKDSPLVPNSALCHSVAKVEVGMTDGVEHLWPERFPRLLGQRDGVSHLTWDEGRWPQWPTLCFTGMDVGIRCGKARVQGSAVAVLVDFKCGINGFVCLSGSDGWKVGMAGVGRGSDVDKVLKRRYCQGLSWFCKVSAFETCQQPLLSLVLYFPTGFLFL